MLHTAVTGSAVDGDVKNTLKYYNCDYSIVQKNSKNTVAEG